MSSSPTLTPLARVIGAASPTLTRVETSTGETISLPTSWLPSPLPPGTIIAPLGFTVNQVATDASSGILSLPDEIGIAILSHLDPVSLCAASLVSRGWRRVASDVLLWEAAKERDFGRFGETAEKMSGVPRGKAAYGVRASAADVWVGPRRGVGGYIDPDPRGNQGGVGVDEWRVHWDQDAPDLFRPPFEVPAHSRMVGAVALGMDGTMVTGGWDGVVRTYVLGKMGGVPNVIPIAEMVVGDPPRAVNGIALSDARMGIAATSVDGSTVWICDRATQTGLVALTQGMGGHNTAWDLAWRDENTLISVGQDGRVVVWDVRGPQVACTLDGGSSRAVVGIDVVRDQDLVFTASEQPDQFAWDLRAPTRPLVTVPLGSGAMTVTASLDENAVLYGFREALNPDTDDYTRPHLTDDRRRGKIGAYDLSSLLSGDPVGPRPDSVYALGNGPPHGVHLDRTKLVVASYADVVVFPRSITAAIAAPDDDDDDGAGVGSSGGSSSESCRNLLSLVTHTEPLVIQDVGQNSLLALAVTDDLLITGGEYAVPNSSHPFPGLLAVRRMG